MIGTSTKATAETVEALKVAKEKGAVTVGLSGYADSLTAQTADYYITYYHADEWYKGSNLGHYNSQGTRLKIAFWLLKEYDNYEAYDKALKDSRSWKQLRKSNIQMYVRRQLNLP